MEKKCRVCQKDKNLEHFNKCKATKDGRQSYCRDCQSDLGKEYRKGKTSELSAKRLAWRKSNKSRDAATNKRWRDKHPESVSCYHQRLRLRALKKVSEDLACSRCGCDMFPLLELNHRNGDGSEERRKRGNNQTIFLDILSGRRGTEDLEITCKPCNAIHYLELKFGKLPYRISWDKNEQDITL